MKHFKQFCAAAFLTLALALSAFAGNMDTPAVTSSSSQPSAAGDILTPGVTAPNDPLTVLALGLLQNALLLF